MGPRRIRFVEEDVEDGAEGQGEGLGVADMGRGRMQVGTVTVPVPMAEGKEMKMKVPGLGRRVRKKENDLNDLGYRMLWSQTRLFSNKLLFLQKSLDAYRNNGGSIIAAEGQDVSVVAPFLETRVGKKMWAARKGKRARASRRADTP